MNLPYFIIIPLLSAFIITLIGGKKDYWAILLSILASFSLLVLSLYSYIAMHSETISYTVGGWKIPYGIVLVQDALSLFMLVLVSLISFLSLLYSAEYIKAQSNGHYYALFMLLVTGMNGVIITGDLFNLFVFMEIALFAAFALVAYGGQAEELEASFKYAIIGTVSSAFILIGIAVTYSATSTLSIAAIADKIDSISPQVMLWIGGFFLAGLGLKAAAIPFHTWLPDAHSSAPAPVSAILSGVFIKTLGIYVLFRIFFNLLGAPPVFLSAFRILGMLSIIIGVFLAIGQWDMKRLLAYHSISQIGYILIGMGMATPLGILGAVFHLMNHAIFKSLLFYNAGAVETALGTRDLRKMGNLTRILPITSSTSMIASLSISGIPPFNGFFSKLIIIIAAVQGGFYGMAGAAVAGSILTLASFLKVQRYGFRGEAEGSKSKAPVGIRMKLVMIALAVLCLITSLMLLPGVRQLALDPVVAVLIHPHQYMQLVLRR